MRLAAPRRMEERRRPKNASITMLKLGTCSRTSLHVLNDGLGGEEMNPEERAVEPLAGGILQKGHQCGLLWGATMAVAAEAHRRFPDRAVAIGVALAAAQRLAGAFAEHAGSVDCRQITKTDFSKKSQMATYMVFRAWRCFRLAGTWAPLAQQLADEALEASASEARAGASCASEVLRGLGASDEEQVMVAGFGGGLGLSGSGCGALSAAIWKLSLEGARTAETKTTELMQSPAAQRIFDGFVAAEEAEIRCEALCGRSFATPAEHSAFVRDGGCKERIGRLVSLTRDELQRESS